MVEGTFTDMLIRIKNAYLARQKTVEIPYAKMKEKLAQILLKEGYLAKVETVPQSKAVKVLRLGLKYEGRRPVLGGIKVISKPSLRIYVKKDAIPSVLGGRGVVILSTPQGLLTGREARKKGLGGELISEVW